MIDHKSMKENAEAYLLNPSLEEPNANVKLNNLARAYLDLYKQLEQAQNEIDDLMNPPPQ